MALFKKKKKSEDEDLSIIEDYKEPFTWSNFWEDHVIGRYKKIKDFLQRNGVLYFLMSPFQAKNRLILKLVLIVVGVMIGVVPRTINMIDSAKERNASSELANVVQSISSDSITINPLQSSQWKQQHVLAFNIVGDTSNGVPSTTSGYEVSLTPTRGVLDEANIKYRYKVLPINQTNRLMVVYIDNRKQDDENGIFGLNIHIKGEDAMEKPIEIVLSNKQETTPIFEDGTIQLSALSEKLTAMSTSSDASPIEDAEADLANALNVYKLNEERLIESGMTLGQTTAAVEEFVKANTLYPDLTDKTTTKDIVGMEAITPATTPPVTTLTYQDKTYTSDNTTSDEPSEGDAGTAVQNKAESVELPEATSLLREVHSKLSALNSARMRKYNSLNDLAEVLNQELKPADMSDIKTINSGK